MIFVCSYFFPFLFRLGIVVLLLLAFAILVDIILLYSIRNAVQVKRQMADRFSIGEENPILLSIENKYPFPARMRIVDEIPVQFQARDWHRNYRLSAANSGELPYTLRPLSRGEYSFGKINIMVPGPLNLAKRLFRANVERTIKVYPSIMQMRRYQLLAVSNRLQEAGVKPIRKLGHSMEFEQIKEYVRGDDYRTINWKATARRESLMVNNYTDEKSQQIYCIVNKGRVMKMPFAGMSLLDYAVNASLVLCNVAMAKQDKAGLITFAENLDAFVPADKKPAQTNLLLETLYRQETRFLESDFEKLFSIIRNRINQRSLLVLFTNFESIESLQREMPALKKIARYHLLLVVFFENTELKSLTSKRTRKVEDIYIKTIAEKFVYEKRLMVRELQKNGILSILSSPEGLTINAINKYLEIKTRLSI